jgi:hypothetical protein
MLPSSSCTCVLSRKYWTLFVRNMAHVSLWHISTIYSVPLFLLHNTQNCYPVSPLVIPGNARYPCLSYIERWMFACLYVCMYGTHTNSHFWTDLNQTLHMPPPWSGRNRSVCIDPKFLTSSTFWALFLWEPLQNHGHKMAAGATVFCHTLISVIVAGVRVTSPTWRRRRRSHPRQPYIRDSSRSFSNVAEMTS